MKKLSLFSFLGLVATLVGCAHGHSRGTVVFKDNEKEGHVCIGHDEVKPGDIVKVYKNICKSNVVNGGERGIRRAATCEKQFKGEGKIEDFSNEHFAKIQALGDLNLEQGLIVEKSGN